MRIWIFLVLLALIIYQLQPVDCEPEPKSGEGGKKGGSKEKKGKGSSKEKGKGSSKESGGSGKYFFL